MSIAFSPWVRTVLNFCFYVPIVYAAEYSGVRHFWKTSPMEGGRLQRKNHLSMARISRRRQEKEESRQKTLHERQRLDERDGERLRGYWDASHPFRRRVESGGNGMV